MKWVLVFALGNLLHPEIALRDVDGILREPLKVAQGKVEALFFITNDCPISNYYSHEIRRICEDYAGRGVACTLVYTDASMTDVQARAHAQEYGHGGYPKIVDRKHELVKAVGAEINPTAVVIRRDESIAYRGRIDNSFASIGKQRRVVTEHDVRDALDAVVAGRPVRKTEAPSIGCYIK